MKIRKSKQGYTHLWLSANDTYNWANKSGSSWPCSALSGHRLYAEFDEDSNLIDVTIDGKYKDCPADEFNAITSDFMLGRLVMICDNCQAVCIGQAEENMITLTCENCKTIVTICEDCQDIYCPECGYRCCWRIEK